MLAAIPTGATSIEDALRGNAALHSNRPPSLFTTMRQFLMASLAAWVFPLLAGGCANPNPQPAPACVRFGPPPAVGTTFGPPAHGPGALAFIEAGIRVHVEAFQYAGGGGTMNSAQIVVPPTPIGNGQVGRANNINYDFDFSGLGWVPSSVDFVFLDMGGSENLGVNGSTVHRGELTAAPASLGGASVTSASNPVPGGKSGSTSILGPSITRVLVGGQEFWIDEVCARP